MPTTRDRFIHTTCSLVETQGFHATGLNQIIRESGAPKGSLYHHFPGGKDELVAAAIERAGADLAARIRENLPADLSPAEAVRRFVNRIGDAVEASGFRSGGPLTAVAMESAATNAALNQACRDAFSAVRTAFRDRLEAGGLPAPRAGQLADLIVAIIEGATILSRTYHTGDPLRRAADELFTLLENEREKPEI